MAAKKKAAATPEFRITSQTICDLGGCGRGQEQFARKFPDGVPVSQAAAVINSGKHIEIAGNSPNWLLDRINLQRPRQRNYWDMSPKAPEALIEQRKEGLAIVREARAAVKDGMKQLRAELRKLDTLEGKVHNAYSREYSKLQRAAAKAANAKLKPLTPAEIEAAVKARLRLLRRY